MAEKPKNPKRTGAPVIKPLKGAGSCGTWREPKPLSPCEKSQWAHRALWPIGTTAFLLHGYQPDALVPLNLHPELTGTILDLKIAVRAGELNENSAGELRRDDIIAWAADRRDLYPNLPFAFGDLVTSAPREKSSVRWTGAEPEIVLEAGTRLVPVAEIPRKIAEALYPLARDAEEMTVSYLQKVTAKHPRGEWLTDKDMDVLKKTVWLHLPPYRDGLTATEWAKYESAFNDGTNRSEWTLVPVWSNPALNNGMLRADAQAQHEVMLGRALVQGEVTAATHAGAPVLNPFLGHGVYISLRELTRYLSALPLPIALRTGETGPQEAAPPPRAKPVGEQHADKVLAAIRAAGYDPAALPPRKNGAATPKSIARKKCSLTQSQFDRAWKRLRTEKRIKETA